MQQSQLVEIYDHAESVAMFNLHNYYGKDYTSMLQKEIITVLKEITNELANADN
jgi:hypothetical protein